MLLISAIIQLLLVIAVAIREFNARSVFFFMWAMCAIIFSVPHLISVLTLRYSFSDSTMMTASLFAIGLSALYLLVRSIHIREINTEFLRENGALNVARAEFSQGNQELVFTAIVVALVASIVALANSSLGGISNATWGSLYEVRSESQPLFQQLAPYLFASAGGALIVMFSKKRTFPLVIFVACCLIYLLVARQRATMLTFACPIALLLFARMERIGPKQFAIIAVCAALAVYAVYAVQVFRHAGTIDSFFSRYTFASFNDQILTYMLEGEGELSLRNIFYYFIEINNNSPGLGQGAGYVRVLLFWLPASLSGGLKPPDFAVTMASAYMNAPGNTVFSVHPTFFGDAFANFGVLGFLVGALWGVLANVVDGRLAKTPSDRRVYYASALSYSLVIIGRGSVYNGFMMGVGATLVVLIVFRLSETLKTKGLRDGDNPRSVFIKGRSQKRSSGSNYTKSSNE